MPVPIVVHDSNGQVVAELDSHGLPWVVFVPAGRLRVGIKWCPECSGTVRAEEVSAVDIGFNGTKCALRQIE